MYINMHKDDMVISQQVFTYLHFCHLRINVGKILGHCIRTLVNILFLGFLAFKSYLGEEEMQVLY